jgi:hypothetical protein
MVNAQLLAFLSRQQDLLVRWTARPHASAMEQLPKAFEKAWQEVHNRILLCETEPLKNKLEGTPLARIPE